MGLVARRRAGVAVHCGGQAPALRTHQALAQLKGAIEAPAASFVARDPPLLSDTRPRAIFIVGAGRLGGALALSLAKAGHRVATSNRTGRGAARARALGIPGPRFLPSEADLVLLCVPDQELPAAVRSLVPVARGGQVVAHCAGAMDLRALRPLQRLGVHAGSMHPLVAVPSPLTAFAGAAAAIDGDAVAARELARVAREVGLLPFRLSPVHRALYHAAAVIAANGAVALVDDSVGALCACGLDRKRALEAVLSLMRSSLDGVASRGLPGGLTGPVARGDAAVVEAHLRALGKHSKTSLGLYRALSGILLTLSESLGSGNEAGKAQIRRALRPPRAERRPRKSQGK